ncbi:hypothetical protein APHAL10511_007279 [Amanita phalloides]|nr:hypothetical protein APHAL10511_007279 [Amanita phalloides]
MSHVHSISSVALASIVLYSSLRTRGIQLNFFFSWLVLVVPLLLSMTVFAHGPLLLSLLLCLPASVIVFLIPTRDLGTPLPSTSAAVSEPVSHAANHFEPLPALTTYRAHMMLMTVLAILAVDFPIFPRTLVKCETFGVSLMDLGVGSFVFSQGVVSAIPILKDMSYLTSPAVPKLLSVTRKSFPVIVLGVVRVLLVKATDYPEHVSEYGEHWNFFLTLALLPVLQVALHPLILRSSITSLGIGVGIGHQLLLSYAHLQEYIFNAPRISWVSANKEGIISLTGYLSIHLLGLSIGTLILPPSPSWFRRMVKHTRDTLNKRIVTDVRLSINGQPPSQIVPLSSPRQAGKTSTELCAYALLWSVLSGIVGLAKFGVNASNKESLGKGLGKGVSRRMVNLPYILWVTAFNTCFLFAYFILDTIFYPSPRLSKRSSSSDKKTGPIFDRTHNRQAQATSPPLLDSINKNGLALFLLANVCTGLVNLSVHTIEASNIYALAILSIYTYGLCMAAWYLQNVIWKVAWCIGFASRAGPKIVIAIKTHFFADDRINLVFGMQAHEISHPVFCRLLVWALDLNVFFDKYHQPRRILPLIEPLII